MADESAPQAEAIPQPRPTAWITGGGALTYARAVATPNADAEDLDSAPQEEEPTADDDANENDDHDDDNVGKNRNAALTSQNSLKMI